MYDEIGSEKRDNGKVVFQTTRRLAQNLAQLAAVCLECLFPFLRGGVKHLLVARVLES